MSTRRSRRIRDRTMAVVPERNAFLIPVILKNFFDQSSWSLEDLRNIRLVRRVWRDVSLPLWRSTGTICLVYGKEEGERTNGILATTFSENVANKNDSFLLQKYPFSKYKLLNWKSEKQGVDFEILWDTFGSKVKELTVEGCNFNGFSPLMFEHIVYVGSPNLTRILFHSSDFDSQYGSFSSWRRMLQEARNPNIEHLEVVKVLPFRTRSEYNFGFHTFLFTFPRLQTLKTEECGEELFYHSDSPNISDIEFFQAGENNFLEGGSRTISFPQLKHLEIMHWNLSPLSEDTIRPLKALKLPLESLSLDLNHDEFGNRQFQEVVKKYVSTLRVLKVFVAPFYRPQPFGGVSTRDETSVVEELELWGNVCSDFYFLETMPQLKKLKMNYDCFEKRKYIENTYADEAIYVVHPEDDWKVLKYDCSRVLKRFRSSIRMEHLTEFHIDLQFEKEDFKIFADKMPNLKSFKSIFNSKTFPVFLREWRNRKLEELHALYGSDMNDTAICGSVKFSTKSPKLSWLKGLRHFTLETYCDVAQLTDRSAKDGFLKSELRSLKICVSPRFSAEMEETLKESIHHVQITRNYGNHLEECCGRMEFKNKALVPREQPDGLDLRPYHLLKREDLVHVGSLI